MECCVVLRKGVWTEKRGMEAGMEAGIDKGKLEVAGNMLERGFALEDICDITGLCEEDILNG